MTLRETSTDSPSAEWLNSLDPIVAYVFVGALVGTVLGYVLFGLAWTGWDMMMEELASPKTERSGDPVDAWAVGVVGMLLAVPVVLAGLIAGAIVGFRLGHRRRHKKYRSQVSAGLILCIGLTLAGCDGLNHEKFRETGGDYGPVTPDMLAGATFTNRTGKDDRYDDLQWVFQEDNVSDFRWSERPASCSGQPTAPCGCGSD